VLLSSTQYPLRSLLIHVDKSIRKIYLLDGGQIVKEFNIALGENPKGHKQQEGDERTPEGIYVLDYINEQTIKHKS
jgi:murein L,D-transpeptidase YafK